MYASVRVTISYEYDDMQRLASVIKDGVRMDIFYDALYDIAPSTLLYEGDTYSLSYDATGNVKGICNAAGDEISKYSYKDAEVCTTYEKEVQNKGAELSSTEQKMGDINPFRFNGHYYDELSGYYMIDSSCYDAEAEQYVMNEVEPYASSTDAVQIMYDNCMSNASFGKSISYSSTWYSSIGELELLARCMYGECMLAEDVPAVGWEIRNRKSANWSAFYGSGKTNTYYNLLTKASMYAAVTGGSSASAGTRAPATSTIRWSKAVWTACALYLTTSRSDFASYVSKPTGIDKQCYHRGMIYCNNFTGTTASTLKCDGAKIKDVVVVGVNTNVTSSKTLQGYYQGPNYHQKNNVFFTHTDELGKLYNITN